MIMIITITLFIYRFYKNYYYYKSSSHVITTHNIYSWILIQYKKDIINKYLIYK